MGTGHPFVAAALSKQNRGGKYVYLEHLKYFILRSSICFDFKGMKDIRGVMACEGGGWKGLRGEAGHLADGVEQPVLGEGHDGGGAGRPVREGDVGGGNPQRALAVGRANSQTHLITTHLNY